MIAFIGAGRAGKGLGLYFTEAGIKLSGYYDINIERSRDASDLTNTKSFLNLNELVDSSEVIFISTGDDYIANAGNELKEVLKNKKKIVGHLSGLHNSKVLKNIFPECPCFSLHPMYSFSGEQKDNSSLKDVVFTIEGDNEAVFKIREILEPVGNKILRIEPDSKALYHGACVFASNYLTTILEKSIKIFKDIGINENEARVMLEPLVKGTVENTFKKGPENSLTGPIARGDIQTISTHINNLKKYDADIENLYKVLGKETLNLATKKLLRDDEKINKIKILLKE